MAEIFVIRDNDTLVPLSQQPYASEDLLQSLLARYPGLLVGDQIDPASPRKWLLIHREIDVPDRAEGQGRWSLDHLFLDQDGVPTLVEVKRSSDTRIRREVVGQMLDYAANAVKHWPAEFVRTEFETACAVSGREPSEVLMESLAIEGDIDQFWQTVKTNLQAGRIRMLFVADEIPEELKRVVEFLNEQMDPAEVLAVEIKQYAGPSLQTLVPRVIGQTAEAESRKGSSSSSLAKRQWDETSFFAELQSQHGDAIVKVARGILEWSGSRVTRIWWGRGAINGSFIPVHRVGSQDHQLFGVYLGGNRGTPNVEIFFQHYRNKPPFSDRNLRLEMLRRLNGVAGVQLAEDGIDGRPGIPLESLAEKQSLTEFLKVMEWYLEQLNRA